MAEELDPMTGAVEDAEAQVESIVDNIASAASETGSALASEASEIVGDFLTEALPVQEEFVASAEPELIAEPPARQIDALHQQIHEAAKCTTNATPHNPEQGEIMLGDMYSQAAVQMKQLHKQPARVS